VPGLQKRMIRIARRYGKRVKLVEPYAQDLPMEFAGTGAELIDLDTALEQCGVFIILVDHDMFKSVPVDERAGKAVYDTRGIWPDQPRRQPEPAAQRIAV
ncbi:UDP binding domain-containing protein, partial [Sphingobium yanoikuyae]|uniref:UDP binding domain-containing protein n=1 Tax=Sphingobium yanoikuyae TaxID=13690 RepID=UPI002431A079